MTFLVNRKTPEPADGWDDADDEAETFAHYVVDGSLTQLCKAIVDKLTAP